MKNETEATQVLLRALERLQLSCIKTTKRFYSDSAIEHYCGKLKEFLDKQEAVKSATPPNSSASNSLVELRIIIVFHSARSTMYTAPASPNTGDY